MCFWVLVGKYGMGSILGPFGGPFGAFSLNTFVHAVAFKQKVNFCIFLGNQKEKKSISSTNFNSKF